MECNYKYLEFVTTTQQQNYANSFTKVQPKHPWCKKERLRTKKGLDGKDAKQIGWPKPPAVEGIKFLIMITKPQNILREKERFAALSS